MYQVPGTMYVVHFVLVPGLWLHPRPSSWEPRDTLSTPQSRSDKTHLLGCRLCRCRLVSVVTPTNSNCDCTRKKRQNKRRTALECIPSRAMTIRVFPRLAEKCRDEQGGFSEGALQPGSIIPVFPSIYLGHVTNPYDNIRYRTYSYCVPFLRN